MRVERRLHKLEREFGLVNDQPRILVWLGGGPPPGITEERCIQILEEGGFLPKSGFVVIDLMDLPTMTVEETEKYLREHGAWITGPRMPLVKRGHEPDVSDAPIITLVGESS